ncbi:deoxyribose-phosphate aldolase [Treponema primitia ZAS-2]|uniref:Deoxyribose-phosphate aldolase n=1 Tax=Treponema primitia (strain ATCC BAA-887 / DSM 12427 / ZAS-2) TaxID=545694 RepID=F5YJK1_TREPZ|nr:deoxyribose-phosphate aldolase [Treponema primitia]AEF85946.1 deoxyribose-phosphate aldolase [Treponema primitia ZAS-2]
MGNETDKKNGGAGITTAGLAKFIDHTLLKPEADTAGIDKLCAEAKQYGFYSVCINSAYVARCAKTLAGSEVKVCVVVGFPLGAMGAEAKAFEAEYAVKNGADEIDMVMNIGAMKSGDLSLVEGDIAQVRKACAGNCVASSGKKALLKVIIETCLLTEAEIVSACTIALKAGADFVKTSTGFSTHGATVEHVALMRKTVGAAAGVKAAGGVRTYEDALAMIKAGATRLGTSGGIKIISGQTIDSGY